jgi:molecular chaperone GrpE
MNNLDEPSFAKATVGEEKNNTTQQQPSVEDNDLENLKKECEEYKSGWMRAQADYQNLQKEVERKRSEWVKMSEVQILEDFIPVYDNFKKAFTYEVDTQKLENWKKGIEYIMKQFGDILGRYSVETIKTVGEKFNPEMHEAVGEEEVEGMEAGMIVREVESGYKSGDRIIKCSKVIIEK